MQDYNVSASITGTTAPFAGCRYNHPNGWAYDVCGKHRAEHCTTFSAISTIDDERITYTFGLYRDVDGLITFGIHGEVIFDLTGNIINYTSKSNGNGSQITAAEILALVRPQ